MNYRPPDIDGTVEAVLDELRDFRRVIAEGTMDEKKAFVRAFVPGITLDPRDGVQSSECDDSRCRPRPTTGIAPYVE